MPYLNHLSAQSAFALSYTLILSSQIPFLFNSSQDSANILIRFHTYYSIFILFMDSCSLWILVVYGFFFYFLFFYSTNHNIPFYISSHIFIISLSYLYHIFIISLSYLYHISPFMDSCSLWILFIIYYFNLQYSILYLAT